MSSRKGTVLGILAVAFFLVSFLPLLYLNLLQLTDRWADNLRIRVFFGSEIPEARGVELKETWAKRPEVAQVTWIGRDEALKSLFDEDAPSGSEREGSLERLVSALGGNPLPHSVSMTLRPGYRTPAAVESFVGGIRSAPEVDTVQYDREGLRRLARLTDGIRDVGIWVFGTIGVALLVLVVLTLRGMWSSAFSGAGMGVGGGVLSLILSGGLYVLISQTLLPGTETRFFPVTWMGGWLLMTGVLGGIGGLIASLGKKTEGGA